MFWQHFISPLPVPRQANNYFTAIEILSRGWRASLVLKSICALSEHPSFTLSAQTGSSKLPVTPPLGNPMLSWPLQAPSHISHMTHTHTHFRLKKNKLWNFLSAVLIFCQNKSVWIWSMKCNPLLVSPLLLKSSSQLFFSGFILSFAHYRLSFSLQYRTPNSSYESIAWPA